TTLQQYLSSDVCSSDSCLSSLLFRRSKFDDRHQKSPLQEHEAHNQAKKMTRGQKASPGWGAPLVGGCFDPNSSVKPRFSVESGQNREDSCWGQGTDGEA